MKFRPPFLVDFLLVSFLPNSVQVLGGWRCCHDSKDLHFIKIRYYLPKIAHHGYCDLPFY